MSFFLGSFLLASTKISPVFADTVTHTLTMTVAGDNHINASLLATSVNNPTATITCLANSEAVKICTQDFIENSNITITATPGNGEDFVSWTGCDTTNNTVCNIKLTSDRHSYATFKKTGADDGSTYTVLAPLPELPATIDGSFKLGDYVTSVFKIGIAIAGVLAVVMLIIGGIMHMISELPGQKETGSTMMSNAIFGLLLALGSWAILNTINPDILSLRFVGGVGASTTSGGVVTGGTIGGSCDTISNTCTSNNCAQYASMITAISSGNADMAKALKAVMYKESQCQFGLTSSATPPAYGLFQLKVATANANKSGCANTPATIDSLWLLDANNAQASACIAKNYLAALHNNPETNGKWENVFAGYSGGATGALDPSVDCQTSISCLNGSNVKRWECPWDNTAHTQLNTGFVETRDYVKKVSYCFAHPGF